MMTVYIHSRSSWILTLEYYYDIDLGPIHVVNQKEKQLILSC